MKIRSFAILSSALFLSAVLFPVISFAFTDVDPSAPEGKAAIALNQEGIINGYADGRFGGSDPITRGQFAKILLLSANIAVDEHEGDSLFRDVNRDHWFFGYVHEAASRDIVAGYPDGKFRPMNSINTAEFLKMLVRTFDLEEDLAHEYEDVMEYDWFWGFAGVAQKYDLFPRREAGKLEPSRTMTRSEVVYAIYRVLHPEEFAAEEVAEEVPMIEYSAPNSALDYTDCSVVPGQLCVENHSIGKNLYVRPGAKEVIVGEYMLLSEPSDARFLDFEIVGSVPDSVFERLWIEQYGMQITDDRLPEDRSVSFSTESPRLDLGNGERVYLKADIREDAKAGFFKIRPNYIDNVWYNMIGDAGENGTFGVRVEVR